MTSERAAAGADVFRDRTGRSGAAVVLLIAGVAVIGTIDNLVRPYLARRGKLQLPTYV
jgi:hypothetical protein